MKRLNLAAVVLSALPVLLGLGVSFFGTILLAKLLGPDVFGGYTYVLTWVTGAALLSKAGHEWLLLKNIPRFEGVDNTFNLKKLLVHSFKAVFLRAILACALLIGFFWISGYLQNNKEIIFFGLALIPLLAISELRRTWALARGRMWLSESPENIIKPMMLAVVIYVIGVNGQLISVNSVLLINLLTTCSLLFFALSFTIIKLAPNIASNQENIINSAEIADGGLVTAMWYVTALNIAFRSLDIFVVGFFCSPSDTGQYAVASRFGQLAMMPIMVLDRVLSAKFSKLLASRAIPDLIILLRRYAGLSFASAVTILLIYSILGGALSDMLLGEQYTKSYSIAMIFLVSFMLASCGGAAGLILTLGGFHVESAKINSITAVVNFILLVYLTSQFGVVGAAIATSIAICMKSLLSTLYVWHRMKLNSSVLFF